MTAPCLAPVNQSVYITHRSNFVNIPHVVVMVGLPARGKSYMAKKLARYLNWIGIVTQSFNLGDYRRDKTQYQGHEFFNSDNKDAVALRTLCAAEAAEDVISFLTKGGDVAIYDGTNTSKSRRKYLYEEFVIHLGFKLFFVESICTKQEIIERNILEVKCDNPDYSSKNKEEVLHDFMLRIAHYVDAYQTINEIEEPDYSYMKIINTGEEVQIRKHEGATQARIIYFLLNIHILPRTVYFTRHGESEYNTENRIGGNSHLTKNGQLYAKILNEYIRKENIPGLKVWTSWLRRSIETSVHIDAPRERWKSLNEIDAGDFDGLTYEEVKTNHENEFRRRYYDKFHYRYPSGESYEDLIARLEPIILELERQTNVLVISHRAVMRCFLGYFEDYNPQQIPHLDVPLHTLFKLVPTAYGCKIEKLKLM